MIRNYDNYANQPRRIRSHRKEADAAPHTPAPQAQRSLIRIVGARKTTVIRGRPVTG